VICFIIQIGISVSIWSIQDYSPISADSIRNLYIALAITLVKRLKELFLNPGSERQLLVFDSKETMIIINGYIIQVFPSHHLDAKKGFDKHCNSISRWSC
jgi:hypothetical protein